MYIWEYISNTLISAKRYMFTHTVPVKYDEII